MDFFHPAKDTEEWWPLVSTGVTKFLIYDAFNCPFCKYKYVCLYITEMYTVNASCKNIVMFYESLV